MLGSARIDAMNIVLARNWWLVALRGVFSVLFGILALVAPIAVIDVLVLFFAAYMLVDGAFAILAAIRAAQKHERWGLLLLEGLLDIIVGIAAVLVPAAAVWAFVLLLAAWGLVSGGLMLGAAFSLKPESGRWFLLLSAVVSILFGLALLINPSMSAIVLTWWLGGYAIAFGALLIVLGFRLRQRHEAAGKPAPPASTV